MHIFWRHYEDMNCTLVLATFSFFGLQFFCHVMQPSSEIAYCQSRRIQQSNLCCDCINQRVQTTCTEVALYNTGECPNLDILSASVLLEEAAHAIKLKIKTRT